MKQTRLQKLPKEERPRERLSRLGPEALSVVELIAVILGSGTKENPVMDLSEQLLGVFGSLEKLSQATAAELRAIKGIGWTKAVQLRAAFGLALRLKEKRERDSEEIFDPDHAYQFVRSRLERESRELFLAILLDVRSRVINCEVISIGTLTNTLIHPRELFCPAIRQKACSIIVAHNHPSGDPTPSNEDLAVTKILVQAGKIIGIPIQDHLIIGHSSYVSFRKQNLLPSG